MVIFLNETEFDTNVSHKGLEDLMALARNTLTLFEKKEVDKIQVIVHLIL